MALASRLFAGDPKLEAAATSHPAHILTGAAGAHVAKIQQALVALDGAGIELSETEAKRYGPSTANAVLAFKRKRNIVNAAYQTQADNIVGIMTVAAMDKELLQREKTMQITAGGTRCAIAKGGLRGSPA